MSQSSVPWYNPVWPYATSQCGLVSQSSVAWCHNPVWPDVTIQCGLMPQSNVACYHKPVYPGTIQYGLMPQASVAWCHNPVWPDATSQRGLMPQSSVAWCLHFSILGAKWIHRRGGSPHADFDSARQRYVQATGSGSVRFVHGGHDSSVGIATRLGLNGPGIETRCGATFSVSDHTGPEAHPASYALGTEVFPGVKQPYLVTDFPSHLRMSLGIVWSFISVSPLCLYEHVMGWPLPSNIYFVCTNAVRLSHGMQFDVVTKTNQIMMCVEIMAVRSVSQRKTGTCVLKIQRSHRQTWRHG